MNKPFCTYCTGGGSHNDRCQAPSRHGDVVTLLELFTDRGIGFELEKTTEGTTITVNAGYAGFYSIFTFDDKDRLLSVEAYE